MAICPASFVILYVPGAASAPPKTAPMVGEVVEVWLQATSEVPLNQTVLVAVVSQLPLPSGVTPSVWLGSQIKLAAGTLAAQRESAMMNRAGLMRIGFFFNDWLDQA